MENQSLLWPLFILPLRPSIHTIFSQVQSLESLTPQAAEDERTFSPICGPFSAAAREHRSTASLSVSLISRDPEALSWHGPGLKLILVLYKRKWLISRTCYCNVRIPSRKLNTVKRCAKVS